MTERTAVAVFMGEFAASISALVPRDIAIGVVGDWLVAATRYGLDGWEFGYELDDTASVKMVAGRVEGALHAFQDIVIRHTTEPWPQPTTRADQGNVRLPEAVVTVEGRRVEPCYGVPAPFEIGHDLARWYGDIIVSLPALEWPAST